MRIGGKTGICGVVVGMVLSASPVASAVPSATDRTPSQTTDPATTVTLITGDQIVVHGNEARSVRPGTGREGMTFSAVTHAGHTYVIPADARQLVRTGQLDRRLFDASALIEFGYDDAHRDDVPLIVSHPAGQAAPRLAGARELTSIDAVAATAGKDGATWEALTDGTATRRSAAGVSRIWLDGKRQSTLDQSVRQIGAPTAWDAGYTGDGATVAVLDTGVDQTHPDLADREVAEQNFSDAPDNVDNFGHGTHVASIVAGTGAKSDGKYRGVAWGAQILDGKVLDDNGSGQESWIIAGMEWAAEQGADVVNLSLGGGDSAEEDPMEAAVNTLSAEHGTLFVIAAGNSGPGGGTVGSPGSAEAALTVGAVDREDELAIFSSRGPRVGDGGIKPDLTAPGVEIVAALHSAGTIGDPVVDGYTALSGTSMATPHVAGAAALLAQQHPDWTGAQLKAALSGSATPHPDLTAFEQGSGRVDVPKAIAATVVSEPSNISLGTVAWPHDDDEPVTKEITYRNLGDAEVTLALTVDATGPDGAPAELFTLSANEVTVPAGGEASVSVTGDTALGEADGVYSGAVVATAGESASRTPVAITREVESYDVTLTYLGEDGQPTADYDALLIGLDNPTFAFPYDEDGSLELRLPKGQYLAHNLVVTGDGDSFSMVPQPGLVVDRDLAVEVDARLAEPVNVTPPVDAELVLGDIGYSVQAENSGFGSAVLTADLSTVSTTQLGSPADGTTVTGKINSQWVDADGSFYGLSWFTEDEVSTGFDRQVRLEDLATLRGEFGPANAELTGLRSAFPMPPNENAFVFAVLTEVALPGTRTEYVTTEDQVAWATGLSLFKGNDQQAQLDSPNIAYEAGGTYPSRFNHAVFGPALPNTGIPWVYRIGDDLNAMVPLFGDSSGNAGFSVTDSASTELYRGTELVGESPEAGGGLFTGLPPESADYRLVTTATRPADFDLTTSITAEWTFDSSHVDGEDPVAVDLNVVRFTPELDAENSAPAGEPYPVPVALQDESGAEVEPKSITVEASFDGGKTWVSAPVRDLVATVPHPAEAGTVSLRAAATDQDGNTVTLTLIDAYKVG
ncbi:S8 family peptidase [Actinophytocola sediminis]